MLTIRKDQMSVGISDEKAFIDWYVNEFMPDHLPEFHESFSSEDLGRMVRRGRNEAIKYGFDDPPSQAHFVTLMWKLGPNFHHFPGFREIAEDRGQPGPERIGRFYQVSDEEGGEAVLGADDRYWFPETFFREADA